MIAEALFFSAVLFTIGVVGVLLWTFARVKR